MRLPCVDAMYHLLHSLCYWLLSLFSIKMFCVFFLPVTPVCVFLGFLLWGRLINLMVLDNPWWLSKEPEFLILVDGASLYCLQAQSFWILTSQRPISFVDGKCYGAKQGCCLSLSFEKSCFFWFLWAVCELSACQRTLLLNGAVPIFLGGITPSERMALKPLNWQTYNSMTNLESRRRRQLEWKCCLPTPILPKQDEAGL